MRPIKLMEDEIKQCDNCKENAYHSISFLEDGEWKKKSLCCSCYCKAGYPPATWHSGCRKFMTPKEIIQEEGLLKSTNQKEKC